MRRLLCAALVLACSFTGASAGTVRTLEQQFDGADLRAVRLDLPVGDVEIQGVEDSRVFIEVRVQCDRGDDFCRDAANDVELVSRTRRNELRLDFDGVGDLGDHDMSLDIELHVPAALAVDVELGVGELRVGNLANDVTAEVGVGEVSVRMKEELVASVDLEVGVGEAKMRPDPRRRSRSRWRTRGIKLGDDVRWDEGTGEARIRVDVGVGGIEVRLR